MKQEYRLVIFFVLAFLILLTSQSVMERLGLVAPPPPAEIDAPPVEGEIIAGGLEVEPGPVENLADVPAFAGHPDGITAFARSRADRGLASAPPELVANPVEDRAEAADPLDAEAVPANSLVLGSAVAGADPADDYRLEVRLSQKGAGVSAIALAQHAAEPGVGHPEAMRLTLLDAARSPDGPGVPFAIGLREIEGRSDLAQPVEPSMSRWEVVPDAEGRTVRPVEADTKAGLKAGQRVVFRQRSESGLTTSKIYTLRKGADTFEVRLRFDSDVPRELTYTLIGPYGLPIEGDWFTRTFREVFFGKLSGESTEVETHAASEVVTGQEKGNPIRVTTLPIAFAGVENQYYTVFFEPTPLPRSAAQRVDSATVAFPTEVRDEEPQKTDVGVQLVSKPLTAAPGRPVEQAFQVYAGPKDVEALAPLGAQDLGAFRNRWAIPGSIWIAQNVISPLLQKIYGLTASVAAIFGGKEGNYGIAIILLTIVVRMMMFPLSRKQAISAKRMQDVKPKLDALREKHKDSKEEIGRATMQLYRDEGIHPLGGCMIAIIQMPIFFGLWQAVNNSWHLRGAKFLWIDNLAAPDQLFRLPFDVRMIGPYFNLLPFLVVGLMLVHMKLFSPPAATPEQASQQKAMKYVMIFMAFMFYWVPSGLGLYFITSSSWAIAERLLLPKHLKARTPPTTLATKVEEDRPRGGGGSGKPVARRPSGGKPATSTIDGKLSFRDKLRNRLEEIMDEAQGKARTHRNLEREPDPDRKRRPRPKPGKPR